MGASVPAQSRTIMVAFATELASERPTYRILRLGGPNFVANNTEGYKLVVKDVDVRFVTFGTGQAEIEWSTFEHPCTSKRALLFIFQI